MQRIASFKQMLFLTVIMSTFFTIQVYAQVHSEHHHNGRDHYEDWPDSLQAVTVSGQVRVDSVFFHPHYFLDEGNDGTIDYQLGFGPYWYEPESGATRPADGDEITVTGGLLEEHTPPLIVVFEIDGLVWRDSTGAPPWSGGWVHRNAPDTTFIYCPTDSLDWMGYPPQGMHGMMFPDSIYCQFEEMPVDSMPGQPDSSMFEGYYTENFQGHGSHMRGSNMRMGFNRDITIRFHYDENEVHQHGFSEESIQVRYLDSNLNWQTVSNVTLDTDKNLITIAEVDVRTFYVLSGGSVTSIGDGESSSIPETLTLLPNYPNPFNPETTIRYFLEQDSEIRLTVYDITGRQVREFFTGSQRAGYHSQVWDGKNDEGRQVASGIYLVNLTSGSISRVGKMMLVR